jgi:hypothetical protein
VAQGRGLGRKLLRRLLRALRGGGSRGVHLLMHEANSRAVQFYRRLGFRTITPPEGDAEGDAPLAGGGSGGDLYMGLRFLGESDPAESRVPYAPKPVYGHDLLAPAADGAFPAWLAPLRRAPLVVCAAAPWETVRRHFPPAAAEGSPTYSI